MGLALDTLVDVLKTAGEPTRFRLLALLAEGDLTVTDLTDILGQSQPRISRHLKLLADFYHLAVNGDDVESVIENHAKDFGHIQIADNPGRGAPGTGTLPLGEWIARSRELGYGGYIGLEYKEPQESAFNWAIRQRANAN